MIVLCKLGLLVNILTLLSLCWLLRATDFSSIHIVKGRTNWNEAWHCRPMISNWLISWKLELFLRQTKWIITGLALLLSPSEEPHAVAHVRSGNYRWEQTAGCLSPGGHLRQDLWLCVHGWHRCVSACARLLQAEPLSWEPVSICQQAE